MPDDDRQGHNGGQGGTPDEPVSPFAPPPAPPPGSPPPPAAFPPPLAPGYLPLPGSTPAFEAPPPWVPSSFPQTSGASPFGPPPGPPLAGSLGLPNGSFQDPPLPHRRRRGVLLTAVVAIVVLALVGGGVAVVFTNTSTPVTSPPSTATSPGARQLLRSALEAAGKVNSFHYVGTSSLSGPNGGSSRTIGDAGPDSGRQDITSGTQRFTVLVIGSACYLKGNASALVANLDFSASDATAHAGQWISLARTDAPYASVYAAVTAPAALADNITVVPQNELPPTTLDGRQVQLVTGAIAPVKIPGEAATPTPKGTATLAVRAKAPHLPVRYTERGTLNHQQSAATVSFSRWGEPVHVTTPAGAIPWAQVGAGSGPVSPTPGGTFLT